MKCTVIWPYRQWYHHIDQRPIFWLITLGESTVIKKCDLSHFPAQWSEYGAFYYFISVEGQLSVPLQQLHVNNLRSSPFQTFFIFHYVILFVCLFLVWSIDHFQTQILYILRCYQLGVPQGCITGFLFFSAESADWTLHYNTMTNCKIEHHSSSAFTYSFLFLLLTVHMQHLPLLTIIIFSIF